MSSPGAPANISTHPAVRKIEAKIQSLEKHHGDEARRLTEAEAKIVELETHIKTVEAKLALVMRSLKEMQRASPLEASPRHFVGPSSSDVATDGAVHLNLQESPVSVSATAARSTPDAATPLSISRIDALLSNLGIRLITVQSDECALEPMNAFGRENLTHLQGDHSLRTVENFVRARENLA